MRCVCRSGLIGYDSDVDHLCEIDVDGGDGFVLGRVRAVEDQLFFDGIDPFDDACEGLVPSAVLVRIGDKMGDRYGGVSAVFGEGGDLGDDAVDDLDLAVRQFDLGIRQARGLCDHVVIA